MDALKLAFDTLIVGALALPWLALLARMYFEPSAPGTSGYRLALLEALPEHTRDAIAGVLVFAIGYLLGAAVTRISDNFFSDEIWHILPTEAAIRLSVYQHEYCEVHDSLSKFRPDLNLPLELGHATTAEGVLCSNASIEIKTHVVTELFRIQENRLLLAGQDKIVRLNEFHDQITILRGSTLNGIALLVLSAFGICACYRSRFPGMPHRILSYIPAFAFAAYGLLSLGLRLRLSPRAPFAVSYHTPPLAELVLILFGVAGICHPGRTAPEDVRLYRNIWVLGLVLSIVVFGAWWWAEALYDEQVLHSYLLAGAQQH